MPQSLSEHSQILHVDFYENFPVSEPRNDRTRNRCVRVVVAVQPDLTLKGEDTAIKRSCDSSSKLIFTQSNWLTPYVPILRTQKCLINLWTARRLFSQVFVKVDCLQSLNGNSNSVTNWMCSYKMWSWNCHGFNRTDDIRKPLGYH
jgi:hypothetical protein